MTISGWILFVFFTSKYTPTDNGACDIAGFSINEVRNFGK